MIGACVLACMRVPVESPHEHSTEVLHKHCQPMSGTCVWHLLFANCCAEHPASEAGSTRQGALGLVVLGGWGYFATQVNIK